MGEFEEREFEEVPRIPTALIGRLKYIALLLARVISLMRSVQFLAFRIAFVNVAFFKINSGFWQVKGLIWSIEVPCN